MARPKKPLSFTFTLTVHGAVRRTGIKDRHFDFVVDPKMSRKKREARIAANIQAMYPQGFVTGTPVADVEKAILEFAEELIDRMASAW